MKISRWKHLQINGLLSLIAFALGLPMPARAADEIPQSASLCAVPPYLLSANAALPHLIEALSAKHPIHIMMVGSSAMAGSATSSPAKSYPGQFAGQLKDHYPQLPVKLSMFAGRGQSLSRSVALIQDNIDSLQPTLVVWQIGLSDVANRMSTTRFNALLEEGIAAIQGAGTSDLIMIDFPYFRESRLLLDSSEYLELIRYRTDYDQIPLLSANRLMRYWDEREIFDADTAASTPRLRAREHADQVHRCLGTALAAQIFRGAR